MNKLFAQMNLTQYIQHACSKVKGQGTNFCNSVCDKYEAITHCFKHLWCAAHKKHACYAIYMLQHVNRHLFPSIGSVGNRDPAELPQTCFNTSISNAPYHLFRGWEANKLLTCDQKQPLLQLLSWIHWKRNRSCGGRNPLIPRSAVAVSMCTLQSRVKLALTKLILIG